MNTEDAKQKDDALKEEMYEIIGARANEKRKKRILCVPFGGVSIGIEVNDRNALINIPEKTAGLKFLIARDNGIIGAPNEVLAYELYKDQHYNYYAIGKITPYNNLKTDMYITIIKNTPVIKGVNYLEFDVTFFPKEVEIIEYGPKTEWLPEPNKNIKMSIGQSFTIPPGINIPISINFKFRWNKKIGRVISGRYGNGVHFQFNKIDEYLDGERSLYFIVRVPKGKKLEYLKIDNIKIRYDRSWKKDIEEQIKDTLVIKVKIKNKNLTHDKIS
jgi:hypothetical protein